MSHTIDHAISNTPYYLSVEHYSEKVHGHNSRVTYQLKLKSLDSDYYEEWVGAFHGQRWILKGDKWFFDCSTF